MNIGPWCGRVGNDAAVRYTPQGKAVADFSFAMDNGKDANGEKRAPTWIKACIWAQKAESLAQYITKGKFLILSGRPVAEAWIDKKSGEAQAKIVLHVSELEFGGGSKAEGEQAAKPKPKAEESSDFITEADDPFAS
jgi:single-strand DNA-binding protein